MLWPTEKESIRIWTTSEVAWGLYDIACVTLDKQGIGDGHLPKSSEHKRQNAPRRRRATGTPAEHLMLAAKAHSHRGRWRQCWPPSSQQPQQKQARGKEKPGKKDLEFLDLKHTGIQQTKGCHGVASKFDGSVWITCLLIWIGSMDRPVDSGYGSGFTFWLAYAVQEQLLSSEGRSHLQDGLGTTNPGISWFELWPFPCSILQLGKHCS